MFPWPVLAPVAFVVAASALLLRRQLALARLRKEHLELLRAGRAATGRVLSLEKTGRAEGTRHFPILELALEVEVQLPDRAPYPVHTRQLVDDFRVAMVQPGQRVALRVDAAHPQRIVVVDAASESEAGGTKLLFDLKRSQTVLRIARAGLLVGLGSFVLLGAKHGWDVLTAPADGFCAAAVRCCNAAPPEPMIDPALLKLLEIEPDLCSLSPETSEASCRVLYEHYVRQAEKIGVDCE